MTSEGGRAGATGVTVSVLSPAVQSTPVNNATGVSTTTDFTWTQLSGAVHVVIIASGASATAPTYYILSTGSSGRIPDLGALGVVLPAATAYGWQILAVGPWASIDDFAGSTVTLPTGNTFNESFTAVRPFTTQ